MNILKKEILKNYHVKVYCKITDLSSERSRNTLIKFIKTKTKKLNLLINNAGLTGIEEKFNYEKKNHLKHNQ